MREEGEEKLTGYQGSPLYTPSVCNSSLCAEEVSEQRQVILLRWNITNIRGLDNRQYETITWAFSGTLRG